MRPRKLLPFACSSSVRSGPRVRAAQCGGGTPFQLAANDRDRTDLSTFILKTYDPHVFLLHLIELAAPTITPAAVAASVYVKDPGDRPRVAALLAELKANPANGTREVWNGEQLASRGSHPDADFGLDVVDGFYSRGAHDAAVKPSTSKRGHGSAPDRPALHASLVMAGPAVQRRGSIGVVRMTQVAPTLAAILNVSLARDAAAPIDLGLARTTAAR